MTHYNIFLITVVFLSGLFTLHMHCRQSYVILCFFRTMTTSSICMNHYFSFFGRQLNIFAPSSSSFQPVADDFTCWPLTRKHKSNTQLIIVQYLVVVHSLLEKSALQACELFPTILIILHCIL